MAENKNTFFEDYQKLLLSIEPLKKDASNPYYQSMYVDLNQVLWECKKACRDHNFIVIQYPVGMELKTELRHISGEKIDASIALAAKDPSDPQKLGSSITYMRRYSLVCLFGLEQVDDDGNDASRTPPKKEDKKLEPVAQFRNGNETPSDTLPEKPKDSKSGANQWNGIIDACRKAQILPKDRTIYLQSKYGVSDMKGLSEYQAYEVIDHYLRIAEAKTAFTDGEPVDPSIPF